MGKPIKISDKLYRRLKDQAESQGLTLQDALVELLTTPYEGLTVLRQQLEGAKEATATQRTAQQSLEDEIRALREELANLTQRADQLREQRTRDVEAFNSWVDSWREIPEIESRVAALERLTHRHFWQEPDAS